jgi:nucleotide-binding universal stress UspA family protein
MKILIAYDGSECSNAAIVDLPRAGLPAEVEALILSVAQAALPANETPYLAMVGGGEYPLLEDTEPTIDMAIQTADGLAEQAQVRLRANFPGWKIATETWAECAQSAILRKAHAWEPDLIVVGSHGRSMIGRLVLGSVSRYVLTHADCSVRISRHPIHPQGRPIRVVIGTDGSETSLAAVRAVASRNWPAGTEARVVGVVDSRLVVAAMSVPEGIESAASEEEALRGGLSKATRQAAGELARAGLHASPQVLGGVPSAVLVAEAQTWGADCIFVGARGLTGLERVLLGCAANAVSARALCSVEVVRPHRA